MPSRYRVSVTLTQEQYETLQVMASSSHRSLSNLVQSMIADLTPLLSQVIQAKTAREASAYLDRALDRQDKEARVLRLVAREVVDQVADEVGPDQCPSQNMINGRRLRCQLPYAHGGRHQYGDPRPGDTGVTR